MRLHGYCLRCRRCRVVRLVGMLRGLLPFGVCDDCDEAGE